MNESAPPFELVVAAHSGTVYRVCRAVLGPDLADDAWSETFLAALQAYPRLLPGSNLEAWLVTIAHRKALDLSRSVRRDVAVAQNLGHELSGTARRASVHSSEPPEGTANTDLWARLTALPLKQRQCVTYHHLAGLPYAEVARIVGGTPEAARRCAADGIAALRRELNENEPAEPPATRLPERPQP